MCAKKIKKNVRSKSCELKIINPDSAGIDIGADLMQVCVPPDRCETNNRAFGSTTSELRRISSWLRECGIRTVLMESTGIYWQQLFRLLLADGFEVYLAHAADVRNMTARKTDVDDAEWLMTMMAYGTFRACFQPDELGKKVSVLARFREGYIKESATYINRMQKSMEQMNIKLTEVLSDITGVSGIRILEAILDGERDPERLASLASGRCRRSRQEIAEALEGTWDEVYMFTLREAYDDYRHTLAKIARCDSKIEEYLYVRFDGEVMPDGCRSAKQASGSAPGFDIESHCHTAYGVNLMNVPGISGATLLVILSELGVDFISKFDTPARFCRWLNLVPNNRITGGRVVSSAVSKRKNRVGQALRQSAQAVARSDNEIGGYYRRMRARSGALQANVDTAHKLARIIYMMVRNRTEYDPARLGTVNRDILRKRLEKTKKTVERLEKELMDAS